MNSKYEGKNSNSPYIKTYKRPLFNRLGRNCDFQIAIRTKFSVSRDSHHSSYVFNVTKYQSSNTR